MIGQEVLNIMTWAEIIIKAFCILVGIAGALIVSVPALKKAIKDRKAAKTAEEKAKADLEIQKQMQLLVSNAEQNYSSLDAAMKKLGESAGQFKKDKVLTDLRDFCDEMGYAFEKQKLSEDIDSFVRMTKEVNTK